MNFYILWYHYHLEYFLSLPLVIDSQMNEFGLFLDLMEMQLLSVYFACLFGSFFHLV